MPCCEKKKTTIVLVRRGGDNNGLLHIKSMLRDNGMQATFFSHLHTHIRSVDMVIPNSLTFRRYTIPSIK